MRLSFPRAAIAIVAAMALVAGCEKKSGTLVAAPPNGGATNIVRVPLATPTNAQPKLPAMKLRVGSQEITAELARKPIQLATGMMFRQEMNEEDGMLFALPTPQQASFYMRNTLVPLTVAYIDPAGRILELHDLKPLDETPVYSRSPNILYVLEMNQGWFTRHGVVPGTTIVSEKGPLLEAVTFEP